MALCSWEFVSGFFHNYKYRYSEYLLSIPICIYVNIFEGNIERTLDRYCQVAFQKTFCQFILFSPAYESAISPPSLPSPLVTSFPHPNQSASWKDFASLVTSDVKHLPMCLLVTCIQASVNGSLCPLPVLRECSPFYTRNSHCEAEDKQGPGERGVMQQSTPRLAHQGGLPEGGAVLLMGLPLGNVMFTQ